MSTETVRPTRPFDQLASLAAPLMSEVREKRARICYDVPASVSIKPVTDFDADTAIRSITRTRVYTIDIECGDTILNSLQREVATRLVALKEEKNPDVIADTIGDVFEILRGAGCVTRIVCNEGNPTGCHLQRRIAAFQDLATARAKYTTAEFLGKRTDCGESARATDDDVRLLIACSDWALKNEDKRRKAAANANAVKALTPDQLTEQQMQMIVNGFSAEQLAVLAKMVASAQA